MSPHLTPRIRFLLGLPHERASRDDPGAGGSDALSGLFSPMADVSAGLDVRCRFPGRCRFRDRRGFDVGARPDLGPIAGASLDRGTGLDVGARTGPAPFLSGRLGGARGASTEARDEPWYRCGVATSRRQRWLKKTRPSWKLAFERPAWRGAKSKPTLRTEDGLARTTTSSRIL